VRVHEGWLGSATLAVLAACGFDTGGIGSGTATLGPDGSEDAGTETASSASASASAASNDATGPTDATDPGDSVDSTVTAVDSGDASGSTSASTDDGGTTGGGAMVHHLMSTDQSACNEPLWCFVDDVWNEYGDPIYGQQCFTSPVAPPFELISVHYIVADVAPELLGFQLEVHSRDETGPTGTIAFEQKSAADATPGHHEHVFATPVQIVESQFCVGFATPYVGLAAALGMAVDIGTSVSDVSFIRLEGPTGCAIPLWSDVIDDRDPIPSGNWCIDVQIREIR
jgi:hypothetical protein